MTNNTDNQKCKELLKLTKKRQNTRLKGYNNIGDYYNGIFECKHVSPYSKSAHNIDADIMIMAQDWSSDNKLLKADTEERAEMVNLGYTKELPTNKCLITCIKKYFNTEFKNTYATNLFPFIKPKEMSSRIPQTYMAQAALDFGIPQIKIIKPIIVICLGLSTFNAIRKAEKNKPCKNMNEAINSKFMIGESTIFCQAHTGKLGRLNRNRNNPNQVSIDWDLMAKEYYKLKN